MLHQVGIALVGPPAAETFADIPRADLIPVVLASLEWHACQSGTERDNAVLNACRALRFACDGVWTSKPAAGAWALGRVRDEAVVRTALDARAGGEPPDAERTDAFLTAVAAEIASAYLA